MCKVQKGQVKVVCAIKWDEGINRVCVVMPLLLGEGRSMFGKFSWLAQDAGSICARGVHTPFHFYYPQPNL